MRDPEFRKRPCDQAVPFDRPDPESLLEQSALRRAEAGETLIESRVFALR
jgi:hypothetical protein